MGIIIDFLVIKIIKWDTLQSHQRVKKPKLISAQSKNYKQTSKKRRLIIHCHGT
jgi:hypothetical protein